MPPLLIATNNHGKQVEIRSLLKDLHQEILMPDDLGLHLEVKEDGTTYRENAAKKALAFAAATGLPALADDTGLEVAALGGAPGLYSARFAPQPNATDADRRAYLLERLKTHPRPWMAQFRCIVALATPEGSLEFTEGLCEGEIIPIERGTHGFGYDPIFQISSLGQTMAELTMEEKNHLSHRALAVKAAYPLIKKIGLP
ncbi:MAG: RdgB/HAM1 family non-canonical purine NTP pyrophosphatase [Anaerolineales bacterium]|jgi:XTP/dITP diphosphohydrolase